MGRRMSPPANSVPLSSPAYSSTYLLLQSCHMPIKPLFSPYRLVLGEILRHYTPGRILTNFANGLRFGWPSLHANRSIILNENFLIADDTPLPSILHFWLFLRCYLN